MKWIMIAVIGSLAAIFLAPIVAAMGQWMKAKWLEHKSQLDTPPQEQEEKES